MDFTQIIITVLLNGLGVLIASAILPGVHVKGYGSAIVTGALLAILNATLWWVFAILSIPLIILTLGLFILVINTIIVIIVDKILDGFKVDSFFWALAFSVLLALINGLLKWIFM
jgi:putative membrane protein